MQRFEIELALAERLSGVDVIVGGGSNTRLFDDNDIPRAGDSDQGQYPQFVADADGGVTAVVNTDGSYKYVGRLVIDFDEDGRIVPGSYDADVSGAYATDAAGVAALGAEALVDPEIRAIAEAVEAQIVATESNVFGVSNVFLNGNRSGEATDGVRTQETNLGNLTADANLAYAQAFDGDVVMSIKNGGGIRASIGETLVPPGGTQAERLPNAEIVDGDGAIVKPAGGISQKDIQTTLAFNNGLTLLTLSAAEIVALLEHGVAALPGVAGQFAQVGGVEFTYDPDLPAGSRILNAEIVDENGRPVARLVQNGEIVEPLAEYRVVTLDFLAAPRFDAAGNFIRGGDGYPFPNTNTDPALGAVGDPAVIARVNATPLEQVGIATGDAIFADDGTEQDALAEYLSDRFDPATGGAAFDEADVAGAFDERILSVNDYTPIYAIQGAALVSPLLGQSVTTRGIVTAVDSNGFYLQDEYGDGDDATSDALFVFTGSAPTVASGDEIVISGTVSEFTPGGASTGNQSTTQISGVTSIFTVETGQVLPAAVTIGEGGRALPTEAIDDDPSTFDPATDGLDFFESLEGMRVSVDNLHVTEATNRFGEVFGVSGNATGLSQRGTLNISPDDFNPERIQFNFDRGVFDEPAPLLDVGDIVANVTGVVSYAFGNYEILPTQALGAVIDGGLQAETTSIAASATQLTIASYNVLNLDPNDADGDTDVADGRFEAVARHILENMGTPDIVGLQEIQDNTGSDDDGVTAADQTLARLLEALDRVDDGVVNGSQSYAFIDNTFIDNNASGGQPGANIRTAFLYNTERVSLVEGSVGTIGTQAPGGSFDGARLPLVASFAFNGETVTVINNHFSSKGGSQPIMGTTQPFEELQNALNPDGSPVVNGSLDERLVQATAVAYEVEQRLVDDPDAKIAVVGDFNEFEFVRPLEILEEAGLTNLTNSLPEDERYSFVFQGNSQSLDHILVSEALAGGAQFDAVHVNAEFASTDERASDHDPLVAGLVIEPAVPETETVTVAFNTARNFFFFRETVADITVGENSAREHLSLFAKTEVLDFADVTLRSEGPGVDFLLPWNGHLGIWSGGERRADRREINDDEFLFIDLGGDADRLALDFKGNRGRVEIAFFDDGQLVGEDVFRFRGGEFEIETATLFDEVRISDGGRKGLRLEGFEFDRRVDDDPFEIAAIASASDGSDFL
nr:5'-nucleotidase C-terminal domain-containing protein [Thalassococcus arenae]